MSRENALLSWTVVLFFLREWQETLAHIRYFECTSNAISPPDRLIEVPAVLFPLHFLFIHSLTKTLSSCRISSSTASRSCWLFVSPEEGSWMEGSWWQWNLCMFMSSFSHTSRQSSTGQHPPSPWLTFKKWWVMSGFLCFMPSSNS